jgi:ATP-dependent exoDNAse (exonuclease V) beta subunit
MKWTSEQADAITATTHTMLVANAGTGKTTTVVGKVLWLLGEDIGVREDGVAIPRCPDPCTLPEIAAITFTEKAAYDLKRKLRSELVKSPRARDLLVQIDRAALGTIHSFCGQVLRENALRLGIDPAFRIVDEEEAKLRQSTLIRDLIVEQISGGDSELAEVFRAKGLYGREYTLGTIDYVRAVMRDLRWHPERYQQAISESGLDDRDRLVVQRCRALHCVAVMAAQAWERHEAQENVRDYDSLILHVRVLLSGNAGADALQRVRDRYRILIIDEFQDTDGAQRDIAFSIAREGVRPQLFLVGDPKQSIYRFRGADIAVWNSVARDLSAVAEPLPLTRNFRSDPAVVAAVNATSARAFSTTATAVEKEWPGESVAHAPLEAAREARGTGGVEWLEPAGSSAEAWRAHEGEHIAARIQQLVGKADIIEQETGEPRRCRHSDIAVLYRARTGVGPYKAALRRAGIPLHDYSPAGLTDRQEIHDVVNYLRLLHNRTDDLRAFALLRSPFIGLRDEVIARIRLFSQGSSLLRQARRYCEDGEWYAAPEHRDVATIERRALTDGLLLFDDARKLADRIPIDELLTFVLDRSGYRNHLLLLDGHREALGNLRAFIQLCEAYRQLSLGAFLQMWEERDPGDPGMPQGQIFSARDDFVTFSTIHAAKGLEWPVVFLVDVGAPLTDRSANQYWTDPVQGAVLCPSQEERGPRAQSMQVRRAVQERAEDARVLYVGMTRARDRLIVTGQLKPTSSFASWLSAIDVDRVTAVPQCAVAAPHVIDLEWLDIVTAREAGVLSRELATPPHRFLTSATELMTRARDREEWKRKYIDGIEAEWFFAPRSERTDRVPASLYGTIVHGVLERIQEESELGAILEETIGDLDAPELEAAFAAGSEYRTALEDEISRVIRSDEWKWYVEGEHYRELPFVHLVGAREWRIGAFDLYRPGQPEAWIIDFKTHQIGEDRVAKAAEEYRIQADIYKAAAGIVGAVRMKLHFTNAGIVVDV